MGHIWPSEILSHMRPNFTREWWVAGHLGQCPKFDQIFFDGFPDRMSLCAWICLEPQLRVQSSRSFSSLISLKATLMLLSKSFQRRQNFSLDPISTPRPSSRVQEILKLR